MKNIGVVLIAAHSITYAPHNEMGLREAFDDYATNAIFSVCHEVRLYVYYGWPRIFCVNANVCAGSERTRAHNNIHACE